MQQRSAVSVQTGLAKLQSSVTLASGTAILLDMVRRTNETGATLVSLLRPRPVFLRGSLTWRSRSAVSAPACGLTSLWLIRISGL